MGSARTCELKVRSVSNEADDAIVAFMFVKSCVVEKRGKQQLSPR